MQSFRDNMRTDIQTQARNAVRIAQRDGRAPARASSQPEAAAPSAVLAPIPPGGGRLIVDRQGDRTVITSAAMPPEVMPLAQMAQETAIGLVALIAAIFILGPFARMIARRMERRPELKAAETNSLALQQQLLQLQQSMDAMSIEVERISESQRFQSRLLVEKKSS